MDKKIIAHETKVKKQTIIGSKKLPFQKNAREAACKCIGKCSCNCKNVKCSVFMG